MAQTCANNSSPAYKRTRIIQWKAETPRNYVERTNKNNNGFSGIHVFIGMCKLLNNIIKGLAVTQRARLKEHLCMQGPGLNPAWPPCAWPLCLSVLLCPLTSSHFGSGTLHLKTITDGHQVIELEETCE